MPTLSSAKPAPRSAPGRAKPAASPRRVSSSGPAERSFVPRSVVLAFVLPVTVCIAGLPYYRLSLEERPWSPWHEWLKPSGYVGQTAGLVALALFLFLWLYPIRKRFRFLRFSGSIARWLDVHIVAGLLVPLVGAIHASWRFQGLIGLGYAAMLVVALSGTVGRYLYVHIPRRRDGLALTREEAAGQRRTLVGSLVEASGLASENVLELLKPVPTSGRLNPVQVILRMVADDLTRRRAVRRLIKEARRRSGATIDAKTTREIRRLARRELALAQQIRLLDGADRVFRLWHAAHRPFAITAFVAVLIHVAVVILLGATWIL